MRIPVYIYFSSLHFGKYKQASCCIMRHTLFSFKLLWKEFNNKDWNYFQWETKLCIFFLQILYYHWTNSSKLWGLYPWKFSIQSHLIHILSNPKKCFFLFCALKEINMDLKNTDIFHLAKFHNWIFSISLISNNTYVIEKQLSCIRG